MRVGMSVLSRKKPSAGFWIVDQKIRLRCRSGERWSVWDVRVAGDTVDENVRQQLGAEGVRQERRHFDEVRGNMAEAGTGMVVLTVLVVAATTLVGLELHSAGLRLASMMLLRMRAEFSNKGEDQDQNREFREEAHGRENLLSGSESNR